MTAIFGLFQRDAQPVPPDLMPRAAQTLQHHAVHGSAIWQAEGIALGQALTRFWTHSALDPQPERDPQRGLTLVSDARLDNRSELAERLGIPAHELQEMPDSRLILRAYAKWEEDCPKYLLGDFVFVIWDARRCSLFAARDPIGIRWLYYTLTPRRLAFASDLAAVLDLMDEPPRLDLISLDDYFCFSSSRMVSHTLYKNVCKLLPAHMMRVQADKIESWAYWSVEDVPPLGVKDPREGAEAVGQLLKEAVTARAQTADVVGVHLSGGLDSSAITALAVQAARLEGRPEPLAFSWSPPYEMRPLMEDDERLYVQRVAEYIGVPVEYTHVPPRVDVLLETSDPSTLPIGTVRFEYTLMENARRKGVRVLLSGWGGDELVFSRGMGYPSGLLRQGRWLQFVRYLYYQYGWRPHHWFSACYTHGLYPLLPYAWQIRLPDTLKWQRDPRQRMLNRLRQKQRLSLPAQGFFQPAFYQKLESIHHTEVKYEWIVPGLHNNQKRYLCTLLQRVESWALWSARLGMRHAYPLFDRRLVEFVLAMPEDWIYWQGKTRRFGFHAVADVLPASLFEGRDKQDRALFAHQKTVEHKQEVREKRLQVFDAYFQVPRPVCDWLDIGYLRAILAESAVPSEISPEDLRKPRHGLWNVLNFAFIDPRATLDE